MITIEAKPYALTHTTYTHTYTHNMHLAIATHAISLLSGIPAIVSVYNTCTSLMYNHVGHLCTNLTVGYKFNFISQATECTHTTHARTHFHANTHAHHAHTHTHILWI